MNILFAGGGSIGHIAPCVSVWRSIKTLDPQARAHIVCSQRQEDVEFLLKEHVPATPIRIPRLSPSMPITLWKGYKRMGELFEKFQPDVVFSKGGAISVPVVMRAARHGVPIVLHESDAVFGRANRYLSRFATVVCHGFSQNMLRGKRSVYTGNPVRPEITQGNKRIGLALTGLSGEKPILLVLGGSQGAQALNETVLRNLSGLLYYCDVVHLTGRGKTNVVTREGYWSAPFMHEELSHLYAIANLALSRAGAGGVSELAANGIPSILVPLRGIAQDHQSANARASEKSGGCIVVGQEELQAKLLPTLSMMISDMNKLQHMSVAMHSLSEPDASKHLAEITLRVGREQRRGSMQRSEIVAK